MCVIYQLIVAVENEEVPRLQLLYERGRENGVADLRLLDSQQLREIEPHCRVCVCLFVCLFVCVSVCCPHSRVRLPFILPVRE